MNNTERFQLIVYEGDFGLPSMDVECIKSILYTAVVDLPVQVRNFDSARFCTFYGAPCFIHKNLKFKSYDEMVMYLRTLKYNADFTLDHAQRGECLALSSYVQSKLKPYLDFLYWIDTRNREEITNVWYMKVLPFPFNYIYTRNFREKSICHIETLYPTHTNHDVIKEFLNKSAVECLSSISTRLGNSQYFFGASPSTLDIIVYSYIAPLIKLPFPVNELSNLPTMWPNLANLIKRIDTKYFFNVSKKSKYIKMEDVTKTNDEEVSYVAILILAVSATSLLLGFAFSKGVLSNKMY